MLEWGGSCFSQERVVRICDLELELPTLVPRQDCRELVEGQILPVDDDSAIRDVTDRDVIPQTRLRLARRQISGREALLDLASEPA